ncbi:MAG: prepilin-type N-terminal cleavage/methylation domain-containing protein [Desulfuromusa sp.]|nr:prepilin-type N-terminal cleavage/methylation domain-containing protein [Desulfuromusa sp.]
MNLYKCSQRGFTLIEIMVVV